MKGLVVLIKQLVVFSILASSALCADELSDILSDNKNILFDYEYQSNAAKSDMLENSWINPIMVQYSRSYSKQFTDRTVKTGSFSIGIDQPIFRSGGIYYAIKYAQALRGANNAQIALKKKETIGNAVKLLFQIKKTELEQKKVALLVRNDKLDVRQKRESYNAGLMDSSFLDQAILKANQDETRMLEAEINLEKLKQNFSLLSNKNPNKIKLPTLKLIQSTRFKTKNLELTRDKLRAEEKKYNAKMTWAKYMPAVSVQGRYIDADLNPLFAMQPGLEERYLTYGFTISMPLNINMFSDIEASKVDYMKAETEILERKKTIEQEYKTIRSRLRIIDKKIALSKKDARLYARLYRTTKNLERAGERTSLDSTMMQNSLKIRKIDKRIYELDKQIELIELYTKVASAI